MVILFILKKEIYRSGKIIGAVRILKGQEILPDDSTLVQHNISDGDTMNVLIEPEHNIEVEVRCGPKVYKHNVSHCMTIKQFKKLLIESNEVAFLLRELVLVTNKDIEEELELDDDSMPLHYYTSDTSIKLKVVGPTIFVTTRDSFGTQVSYNIWRKTTVSGLKDVIKKSIIPTLPDHLSEIEVKDSTFDELGSLITYLLPSNKTNNSPDISLFVACDVNGYKKLDEADSTPLCKLLSESDVVYYIDHKLHSNLYHCQWPLYHQDNKVGTVYIKRYGSYEYEKVRTIKLRIQDEMGIPANCITVYANENHRTERDRIRDDYSMRDGYYINIK